MCDEILMGKSHRGKSLVIKFSLMVESGEISENVTFAENYPLYGN